MELIRTGLQITIFGMGLVFLLLGLLWGLMTVLLRLDQGSASSEEPEPADVEQEERTEVARAPAALAPEQLAAISIAVLQHRAVCRKQATPAMRGRWPGALPDTGGWVAAGRTRQNRSWQSERR
jgi:sodium pump decarboxylase gamma subunit